ncbi:hypothetical protein AYO20_04775 [Fonsecaea nubica]|uniref:Clr5 domain-containing protein n=1 Tax=Fonsecaea nubica TaxID=856822 RepID=A0A178D1C3_9EURO|nr:hypothetical protein AYO20_04775 [Fonsecaea nubica]OAL35869.1 hypothetical protein AYO20_04775 [Fonsecaea nubica]
MDQNFSLQFSDYRSDLPLAEKWNRLKPAIARLYVEENRKAEEVQEIIRRQCGFDLGIHQLKYQIRKWKLKKNIPTPTKTKMFEMKESRASRGKETVFEYHGKAVDNKKLARLAKNMVHKTPGGRKEMTKLDIAPGIFIMWNMPYGALRYSQAGPINHISPNVVASTPAGNSDIVARTPGSYGAQSPATDSPSGLSRALRTKTALERAYLFVEGKHNELLRSMEKSERMTMSTWLYHFWLFAYKTARYWGRGPRNWTADLLELDKYVEKLSISTVGTPDGPRASADADQRHVPASQWLSDGITPSILCNWGVHVPGMSYERAPHDDSDDDEDDENDEWKGWPQAWKRDSFVKKLHTALSQNLFSNIDADNLPIALSRLLTNSSGTRDQFLEEGLAFSIMGRNVDLMFSLAREIKRREVDVEGIFPFHLATTYLCGSNPCCNAFGRLLYHPGRYPIRAMYVNDRGHTVLDNLMIVIVKAHTSCVPGDVDEKMKSQRRFAGEEVDICGRWDADSKEIRALVARGLSRIPFDWKHKFCHTSTQVVCHCISLMFGAPWKPDIDRPSGLFKKQCQHCTLRFTLLPLHTLVMVAFLLAERGCEEEDLFGMIACLVCLLSRGANPLRSSRLSAPVLYGTDQDVCCTHKTLTPLQLVKHLPQQCLQRWTPAIRTGWIILSHVLRLSERAWRPSTAQATTSPTFDFSRFISYPDDAHDRYAGDSMDVDPAGNAMDIDHDTVSDDVVDEDIHHCHECGSTNHFHGSHQLRDLWAAIQAELLTYRRLRDGHRWVSPNFNMDEVLRSLERGRPVQVGLIERKMLRDYCDCGNFLASKDHDCPCVDMVCAEYFSNLEEWDRTTFLWCPEKRWHQAEASDKADSDYSDPDYPDEEESDDEDF